MNWSRGITWLASLRDRHAAHRDADDPADMGTAFGLDASIAPSDWECAESHPGALPLVALPWESRLVRRSGL